MVVFGAPRLAAAEKYSYGKAHCRRQWEPADYSFPRETLHPAPSHPLSPRCGPLAYAAAPSRSVRRGWPSNAFITSPDSVHKEGKIRGAATGEGRGKKSIATT